MPRPKNPVIEAARGSLHAEYVAAARGLEAAYGATRNPDGSTPDAVKFSPEYRRDKAVVDAAFAALRRFNTTFKP